MLSDQIWSGIGFPFFHWRLQTIDTTYQLGNAQLGPVHTYPDIFESATFSFRIQKFLLPEVAYSNRIRPSTRIRWYPDFLLFTLVPKARLH